LQIGGRKPSFREVARSSLRGRSEAESDATLPFTSNGSTGALGGALEYAFVNPSTIFRQEFSGSRTKIKFRFFLVGSERGF
jgi:hypothetical protein